MQLDDNLQAGGWITSIVLAICGGAYSVFRFMSGTRAELQAHTERLATHDRRFETLESNMVSRLDRLDLKIDTHHAQLAKMILRDRG